MSNCAEIRILAIEGIGEIQPGDCLAETLIDAIERAHLQLREGDILVVKHKVVSKAEGRVVSLQEVQPSDKAKEWATRFQLDSQVIELALRQSKRIVRQQEGVLITETSHGLVCANSGVDVSNLNGGSSAALLPENPDRSAVKLHLALNHRLQLSIPVIISDSFGRAWREGLCEVAIGVAGLIPLRDYRGKRDRYGYQLHATVEAVADELACAAGLICGKLNNTPACIIRGFGFEPGNGRASDVIRPASRDLFR